MGNRIKNYYELTKPKIWYLLVFTAFGAALTASLLFNIDVQPWKWVLLLVGMTGISLACAWLINYLAFALMAFGLFDNIIVYSKWLKRRSQANIILGGFSGAAPALIGYVTITTQNIEIGIIMAALVFLWIPTHIWSLALHVKADYTRARVPMLPVVSNERTSVRVIAITTLLMVIFSVVPFFTNQFGLIYLTTATVFGIAMITLSIWLMVKPSKKVSWIVFKFSSPYLSALFIAFMVDAAFH